MGANTKDGAQLTGLLFARRRRRLENDLLVKSAPNDASPIVFGDWLFDAAASGNDLSGAITEGSDTLSGTVGLAISLSGAVTEGSDSSAGNVGLAISVTGSINESSDTVAGTVANLIVLTGAITEGSDVLAGTTDVVSASSDVSGAIAESSDTVAGTADLEIEVSGSVNESSDQATGTVESLIVIDGTLTEGSDDASGDVLTIQIVKKTGGDSAPAHVVWEKRKKRKKTDESLTLAIESAYKQIMGEEPTPEVVEEIKQEIQEPPPLHKQDYSEAKKWVAEQLRIIESRIERMREEEEEEAILLLM